MIIELLLKMTIILLGGLLLLYTSLYLMQDQMLFHRRPLNTFTQQLLAHYHPRSELIITTPQGIRLHGWLLKNSPATSTPPLIIYFGGNAEEASEMVSYFGHLNSWSLLLINYRGYGLSEGNPSEQNLFSDAITIFDTISQRRDIDTNCIVVMGRSLGSGVAVYLTAHRPVKGVILVSPYDSMTRVTQRIFPYVPVTLLLKHPFNSIVLAPAIKTPMLALVAQQDTLISPEHSYQLAKQWGGYHEVKLIPNTGHNNISDHEIYWQTIKHFLQHLACQPSPAKTEQNTNECYGECL